MTKLHEELKRLRELRERATPGQWKLYNTGYDESFPTTVDFTQIAAYDDCTKLSVVMCRLGKPDKICMEKTNAQFMTQSANRWLSLIEALECAVDTLKKYNAEENWEVNGMDEYPALAKIEQLICGDTKTVQSPSDNQSQSD